MPTGDVSLAIGYWIVSHKATLKRWWAITLMAVIFLATVWVVVSMTVYFSQDRRVTSRLAESAGMVRVFAPRLLGSPLAPTLGAVTVLTRDAERADLVGMLQNPNQSWGATSLTYHFTAGTYASPTQTTTLNPGETRPVMVLNQAIPAGAVGGLTIESVQWAHVSTALPAASFKVDSVSWDISTVRIGGQAVETIAMKATLSNTSAYNFYRVDVPVIVRSADGIVAIDELPLNQWPSRTQKSISVSWPYRVSGVTSIDITPTVSRFDPVNRF